MARILVVDNATDVYESARLSLCPRAYSIARVVSGTAALKAMHLVKPEIAIVELALPDMSGLEVLRHIRDARKGTACVLVTAMGTYAAAVEALRYGACQLASKPLNGERLVDVIERAQYWRAQARADWTAEADELATHAVDRWAAVVVRAIGSSSDLRTLAEWGREVGVSTGALRNWCRTASVSARRSVLFMRVLRAVYRQRDTTLGAEDLLDIVDRRTIAKVISLSGGQGLRLPSTVVEFLEHQRLIDDIRAVAAIRTELTRRT